MCGGATDLRHGSYLPGTDNLQQQSYLPRVKYMHWADDVQWTVDLSEQPDVSCRDSDMRRDANLSSNGDM